MHASNGAMSPRPSPTTPAVHSLQHAATRVPPAPAKPIPPLPPTPPHTPRPRPTRCCRDPVQARVLLSFITVYDCSHQGSCSTTSPRGAGPPLSPERRAPAPCHRPSPCSHHDHPESAPQSCAGRTDWAAPFAPARSRVGPLCKCRPALPSLHLAATYGGQRQELDSPL